MMASAAEGSFDVIVVGAGHAGTEAAVAAARLGATVGLITSALEAIGQMSCNPAIGGIAKGTVVREVDALGGIMGRATDLAMVQFRMLNRSKGPAVWAPRAQCDRSQYRRAVRSLIEAHDRVYTLQATVARLLFTGSRITGIETLEGRQFLARAVVITAGTFLRGRIFIGTETRLPGGRAGEAPSTHLASQLEEIGLTTARFKTGTPPRIDGRSVDLSRLERQDSEVEVFDYTWSSFWSEPRRIGERTRHPEQLPCWSTFLESAGQKIIRENIGKSAMYGGAIASRGPRYCPSVEDKVVKFPQAERHQIFLEPEGHDTQELYVNGLSTSLPSETQVEILRTIRGLEQARMTRAGYAIEYDYYDPKQLDATLRVRALDGLFLAGQINGTTGYEEAAGQGFVAGVNAAAFALDRESLVLGRQTSYIGVLVDDLVVRGVDEPYRLFTSRSEFRLTVRQDNPLRRLAAIAQSRGLYTADEWNIVEKRLDAEDEAHRLARESSISPDQANPILGNVGSTPIPHAVKIVELAKRQHVALGDLLAATGLGADLPLDAVIATELELKYEGYFIRERQHANRLQQLGEVSLPEDLPYTEMRMLSFEARQKLAVVRPRSFAQASSIPGVSPSDLQNLLIELRRHEGSKMLK